jgi:hypothetical protein
LGFRFGFWVLAVFGFCWMLRRGANFASPGDILKANQRDEVKSFLFLLFLEAFLARHLCLWRGKGMLWAGGAFLVEGVMHKERQAFTANKHFVLRSAALLCGKAY